MVLEGSCRWTGMGGTFGFLVPGCASARGGARGITSVVSSRLAPPPEGGQE